MLPSWLAGQLNFYHFQNNVDVNQIRKLGPTCAKVWVQFGFRSYLWQRMQHDADSTLSQQKSKFESTVDSQAEENSKLFERNFKIRQRLEVVELCADFSLPKPPEWQQMCNIRNGPYHVLEVYQRYYQPHLNNLNFAQSDLALTRTKSNFKIHVLSSPLDWINS